VSLEARAVTGAGPPAAPTGPAAEEPPDETHRPLPQLDHSIAPRKPRTIGGAIFLGVLGTTALGIALVLAGRVQAGLSTAGAAFLGGAVARLVLPGSQAGMLGVRRKLIDVSTMVLLGAGLLLVAALIREPAG
jgi:hypothetical protein